MNRFLGAYFPAFQCLKYVLPGFFALLQPGSFHPVTQGLDYPVQPVAHGGIGNPQFFFHILNVSPAFDKYFNKLKLLGGQAAKLAGDEFPFQSGLAVVAGQFADDQFFAADRAASGSTIPNLNHLLGLLYPIVYSKNQKCKYEC
jgi:hypothetical protein